MGQDMYKQKKINGTPVYLVKFIKCFLSGRKQHVKIDEYKSDILCNNTGAIHRDAFCLRFSFQSTLMKYSQDTLTSSFSNMSMIW